MTYMDVEQQKNRRRENMINKKGGLHLKLCCLLALAENI
jgi:hypothetical protein